MVIGKIMADARIFKNGAFTAPELRLSRLAF